MSWMIRSAVRFAVAFSLVGLVLLSAGCGGVDYDGPERAAVSGTVTLDGAPLPYGTITFKPTGDGRMANGPIEEGAYSIPEESGPNPGQYKVDIRGYGKSPAAMGEGEGAEEAEDEQEFDLGPEIVPQNYNATTTLEVEITSGENIHDFPLKKD